MKRLVLVVSLLFGILLSSIANEEVGKKLQGRVTDAQGEPVEFATAILLQAGEQVSGAVTDSLGCFALEAASGHYELHVQYVGYEPIQQEV
ncbi:MAG: carboxypeptidase-like regulatory domain-containing protein, partial [Parabacteroides sp.]